MAVLSNRRRRLVDTAPPVDDGINGSYFGAVFFGARMLGKRYFN